MRLVEQGTTKACFGGCLGLLVPLALTAFCSGQSLPPPGEPEAPGVSRLDQRGRQFLARDDVLAALDVYRRLRVVDPEAVEGLVGLGQVYLRLGRARIALKYAKTAVSRYPDHSPSAALHVESLIRARMFERAEAVADRYLRIVSRPCAKLISAHASAMFRVQRIDDATRGYQRVLMLDARHPEAHLRLGSGLLGPREIKRTERLREGVSRLRAGEFELAVDAFSAELLEDPGNPVAHRLMGESLLARDSRRSIVEEDAEFLNLTKALSVSDVTSLPIAKFIPGFEDLSPDRKAAVIRSVRLFGKKLPRLIAIGGQHDLLMELERTTDQASRQRFRGRRTFDGRIWDDVRGMGGLRAATGIEALDDVRRLGFDTLAHEIAHQIHLYVMNRSYRLRIRALYQQAEKESLFLDYYAGSNEAEYFAQGVEAFASLGKRPCSAITHGHTRFELYRRDPDLHDLIASLVDHDLILVPEVRESVLPLAIEVALRCGRPEDAVLAAKWMPTGPRQEILLDRARRAMAFSRFY